MYELKNGTARIVCTLKQFKDDSATVTRLAQILHYIPEQLAQDMQSVADFYDQIQTQPEPAAQIRHDPQTSAYTLDGEQIHCGQRLDVLIVQDGSMVWETVRFELDGEDQPYFPGHRGTQVSGLFARIPEKLS